MGSRPSSFKKSGGFLNGVDGTFTGYQFTDAFNGEPFKPGRNPRTGKDKFHSLYCVVSARADGAAEDVTVNLFAGGADDYEVSDDGHVLTNPEGGACNLGANTGVAKFFSSLVQAGFPEALFSDDDDSIDFSPAIGTRVRFEQRKDAETTAKIGKRKVIKDGVTKEYDRQDLVVTQVYDVANPNLKATPKGGKVAPNTAMGKPGKPAPVQEEDIAELSTRALTEILTRAGGTIAVAKLSVSTLTTPLLKGNPQRDEVRGWLVDAANLAQLDSDLFTYNKKKGTITLIEEEESNDE